MLLLMSWGTKTLESTLCSRIVRAHKTRSVNLSDWPNFGTGFAANGWAAGSRYGGQGAKQPTSSPDQHSRWLSTSRRRRWGARGRPGERQPKGCTRVWLINDDHMSLHKISPEKQLCILSLRTNRNKQTDATETEAESRRSNRYTNRKRRKRVGGRMDRQVGR